VCLARSMQTTMTPQRFDAGLDQVGHILRDHWLKVPRYQRSYAWDKEEVALFWEDLRASRKSDYFVGTIVLTPAEGSRMEIIDGQQRLATTALIIAAIRDRLAAAGDRRALTLEKRYLASESLSTGEPEPRLRLSEADHEFFTQEVVFSKSGGRQPASASNTRLAEAYAYLRDQVSHYAEESGERWQEDLLDWVNFLDQRVRVILVRVENDADAFLIFETLNDRGIALNIADLLKNYLLGRARDRIAEADRLWNKARNALEVDRQDEAFSNFIRHYWSSRNGATREKDLYRTLRGHIDTVEHAISFLGQLEQAAPLYAALLDSRHSLWADKQFGPEAETLLRLGLQQNRPLLLAALEVIDDEELRRLTRSMIAWAVRGLIVGGIGGGTYERYYADAATKIRSVRRASTRLVREALDDVVPTDADFTRQFSIARVRNLRLTGYYLRAIENELSGIKPSMLVTDASEEESYVAKIIGPRSSAIDWPGFGQDEMPSQSYRLGNAVLLEPELAPRFAEAGWHGKQQILKRSHFVTSRAVAQLDEWSPDALDKRQTDLASVAKSVWPR
jgi:uncharacterized protein DUF262/uncharacterized protein DUF1524